MRATNQLARSKFGHDTVPLHNRMPCHERGPPSPCLRLGLSLGPRLRISPPPPVPLPPSLRVGSGVRAAEVLDTLERGVNLCAIHNNRRKSHRSIYIYIYIYICICTCIYVYVYIYIYIYIGWGRKLRNAQVRAKDDRAQLGSFHEELLRFNTMPRRPMPLLVHFRQTGRQPSNGEG